MKVFVVKNDKTNDIVGTFETDFSKKEDIVSKMLKHIIKLHDEKLTILKEQLDFLEKSPAILNSAAGFSEMCKEIRKEHWDMKHASLAYLGDDFIERCVKKLDADEGIFNMHIFGSYSFKLLEVQ